MAANHPFVRSDARHLFVEFVAVGVDAGAHRGGELGKLPVLDTSATTESSSDSYTAELSTAVIQAWGRSRIRIGAAKARRRGSRIGSERGPRIIERWKRRDRIIGGRSGRPGKRTKVRLVGDGLLAEGDDRSQIYRWQAELGRTDQGSGVGRGRNGALRRRRNAFHWRWGNEDRWAMTSG
jgi:hypothetical protein